jgi:plasmid stabilization system protein ParE
VLKVWIHPAATVETGEARLWYLARSADAASAFVAEIDRALARIAESPKRWPERSDGRHRYALRRFPFIVVFCVEGDELRVLAVQHGRRRPEYWKARK